MAVPVKTVQVEPIAIRVVAAATGVVVSTVINTASMYSAAIFFDYGAIDVTASPANGYFAVQGCQADSGSEWVNIFDWLSPGATAIKSTLSAGVTAGDTTFGSATSQAIGQWLFVYDPGAVANSEWVYVVAKSGAGPYTYTIQDGFVRDHTALDSYNQSVRYKYDIDLSTLRRVRMCFYNNRGSTTRGCVIRCGMITLDSIS